MLFIMFNDFENFIVIKGNDKEEYAWSDSQEREPLVGGSSGDLRKVALEPPG